MKENEDNQVELLKEIHLLLDCKVLVKNLNHQQSSRLFLEMENLFGLRIEHLFKTYKTLVYPTNKVRSILEKRTQDRRDECLAADNFRRGMKNE